MKVTILHMGVTITHMIVTILHMGVTITHMKVTVQHMIVTITHMIATVLHMGVARIPLRLIFQEARITSITSEKAGVGNLTHRGRFRDRLGVAAIRAMKCRQFLYLHH
jgi:hypothetical protein